MEVTVEGIIIDVIPEQDAKADAPIVVTPSGRETESKLEQEEKAFAPIEVRVVGNVIDVKLEHPEKT